MGNLNCASGKNIGERYELDFDNKPLIRKDTADEEDPLQKLKDSVTNLENQLTNQEKEALVTTEKIKRFLGELKEQESKDTIDGPNEGNADHQECRIILTECEKTLQSPQSIQKSFQDVRAIIDGFFKEYEHLFIRLDNTKDGESENKIMENKSKVAKPIKESKKQNKTKEAAAQVQLLFTQDGDMMKDVVTDLVQELKGKIGSIVDFIHIKDKSNVDDNILMIIIYHVSTRVGADASNAVANIKNTSNAVLLLIHKTEGHTISDMNSKRNLVEKEFRELRDIFDMYYKKGYGFSYCDMNEKSMSGLSSFCTQSPNSVKL